MFIIKYTLKLYKLFKITSLAPPRPSSNIPFVNTPTNVDLPESTFPIIANLLCSILLFYILIIFNIYVLFFLDNLKLLKKFFHKLFYIFL